VRYMSFLLTTPQILARTQTVTRRLGWKFLKAGDLIQAVDRVMGFKKGESPKRLAVLRVTNVRRESLDMLVDDYRSVFNYGRGEVDREGFRGMPVEEFVDLFCASHRRCERDAMVTRIEFEYLAEVSS
jgi:hypothetical protein